MVVRYFFKIYILMSELILNSLQLSLDVMNMSMPRKYLQSCIVTEAENIASYIMVRAIFFFFIKLFVKYTILQTRIGHEVYQHLYVIYIPSSLRLLLQISRSEILQGKYARIMVHWKVSVSCWSQSYLVENCYLIFRYSSVCSLMLFFILKKKVG